MPLKPFASRTPPKASIPASQTPAGFDIEAALIAEAKSMGEKIALQVVAIDQILRDIDYRLNDFQPALTGKIRILWEFRDGFSRPQPAVYRRSKVDGQWKYDKVGGKGLANRSRTAHAFHRNREVVRPLLQEASSLMAMRTALISSITQARLTSTERLKSVGKKALAARARVDHVILTKNDWRRFSLEPLNEEYVDLT